MHARVRQRSAHTHAFSLSHERQESQWPKFAAKMEGMSEAAVGAFKRNYDQLVAGATGMVRCALGGGELAGGRIAAGAVSLARVAVCCGGALLIAQPQR